MPVLPLGQDGRAQRARIDRETPGFVSQGHNPEEMNAMDGNVIILIEAALILGGVLTFAVGEVRSLRRARKS